MLLMSKEDIDKGGYIIAEGPPEAVVEEPGTFSRRGGLIDVFPPNLSEPVRIELYGDEIDSLRAFEPTTQRSSHRLDRFVLAPATEALPRLASSAAQKVQALDLSQCHPPAKKEYQEALAALQQGYTRPSGSINGSLYIYVHTSPGLQKFPICSI